MDFLLALEQHDRWGNKRIVLDCNAKNAKNILVEHVRKVQLGRRTYHYMLSGLVSTASIWLWFAVRTPILFFLMLQKCSPLKRLYNNVIQRNESSDRVNFLSCKAIYLPIIVQNYNDVQ